jgi:hypothetical protein
MTSRRTLLSVLLVIPCLIAMAPALQEEPRTAAGVTAKITDLAWLAGDWRSERGGEFLQESWSEPIGDSMMCSFRWMKGGKTWMYELITITEEGPNLVLRLKHFSAQLAGWEAKDESLDFTLVRLGDQEAVFEHPTRENARRLTYHRTGDTLIARVEGIDKGRESRLEIEFKRNGP